jgi:hypothetical protein
MTKHGKHGNAAMFYFTIAKAIEVGLFRIVQKSEWIEESKWWLDSNLLYNVNNSNDGD